LFSISKTSRGFFCLEWSSTENGPQIINSDFINIKKDFYQRNLLKEITSEYNLTIKDESNSLSIILSNENVIISSIDTPDYDENNKMVEWYESNIMGNEFCNNYDNYYYPMAYKKNKKFLIVSVSKIIKKNIIESSNKLGFNLIYLSVDIFSSSILVQNIYKTFAEKEYIIWKLCNNNSHLVVLYKGDLIYSYVKIKKKSNKYIKDVSFGENDGINKSLECLNTILNMKKKYNKIDKIFIYQTKENTKDIKDILKLNYNNIQLLSLNNIVNNSNNNDLKYMNYVENGICFQGLDL